MGSRGKKCFIVYVNSKTLKGKNFQIFDEVSNKIGILEIVTGFV
jgi:hypothetical protein